MVSSQHDPVPDAAVAQPADAESAPPRVSPAASDGSASSRHRPVALSAPAASAMSGATAAQTAGSAGIAVKPAQSAAEAAPDIPVPDLVAQAVEDAIQAVGNAADAAAHAAPVMPAGVVAVIPIPAPPPVPSADGAAAATQSPADGLPGPAPPSQPAATAAPLPLPLAEVKGRNAIAEKVEKGMRQHFPGMTDETLAKWHSNLEERLSEAKAAHKVAKDGIKEVGLRATLLPVASAALVFIAGRIAGPDDSYAPDTHICCPSLLFTVRKRT